MNLLALQLLFELLHIQLDLNEAQGATPTAAAPAGGAPSPLDTAIKQRFIDLDTKLEQLRQSDQSPATVAGGGGPFQGTSSGFLSYATLHISLMQVRLWPCVHVRICWVGQNHIHTVLMGFLEGKSPSIRLYSVWGDGTIRPHTRVQVCICLYVCTSMLRIDMLCMIPELGWTSNELSSFLFIRPAFGFCARLLPLLFCPTACDAFFS